MHLMDMLDQFNPKCVHVRMLCVHVCTWWIVNHWVLHHLTSCTSIGVIAGKGAEALLNDNQWSLYPPVVILQWWKSPYWGSSVWHTDGMRGWLAASNSLTIYQPSQPCAMQWLTARAPLSTTSCQPRFDWAPPLLSVPLLKPQVFHW